MLEPITMLLFGITILFVPILSFAIIMITIDCFRPENWLNHHDKNNRMLKQLWFMLIVLLVLDYIFLFRPAFA